MTMKIKIFVNEDGVETQVAEHTAERQGPVDPKQSWYVYKVSNGTSLTHNYNEGVNQLALKTMQQVAPDDLLKR